MRDKIRWYFEVSVVTVLTLGGAMLSYADGSQEKLQSILNSFKVVAFESGIFGVVFIIIVMSVGFLMAATLKKMIDQMVDYIYKMRGY